MNSNQKKIGWINSWDVHSGGVVYDKKAISVLSKKFDVEIISAGVTNYRPYKLPQVMHNLSRISGKKDLWIREFKEVVAMPWDKTSGKNMALIYHIDASTKKYYIKPFFKLMERAFYKNLWNVDVIVTICKHFYNDFKDRGYADVRLIYPAYNVADFEFTGGEIEEFKKRFNLTDKPIIYIGNCQKAKGVVESYNALKDLDAHIVTSGEKRVDISAKNLNLDHRDYLRLLKASSVVVTMSKFLEGWLLTAHEAMLCKTPVVGSPGLSEILEDGGQIVCEDFSKLKENVEYLMEHPEVGEKGYDYVKQFTDERFEREWLKLAKEFV